MIILHENLQKEAENIAKLFNELYNFNSEIINLDLTPAFLPIPEFNGFWESTSNLKQSLGKYGDKKVFVLTSKDIYYNNASKDDDWIFAFCADDINMVVMSTARMKRFDSKLSEALEVPEELYIKRLEVLALHEVAHDIVKGKHLQNAVWVNIKTGYKLNLDLHCTDNSCALYEIVDIRAPPPEDGYMQIGDEKKYDAGLDDVIERLNPNWLCDNCQSSIEISEGYR